MYYNFLHLTSTPSLLSNCKRNLAPLLFSPNRPEINPMSLGETNMDCFHKAQPVFSANTPSARRNRIPNQSASINQAQVPGQTPPQPSREDEKWNKTMGEIGRLMALGVKPQSILVNYKRGEVTYQFDDDEFEEKTKNAGPADKALLPADEYGIKSVLYPKDEVLKNKNKKMLWEYLLKFHYIPYFSQGQLVADEYDDQAKVYQYSWQHKRPKFELPAPLYGGRSIKVDLAAIKERIKTCPLIKVMLDTKADTAIFTFNDGISIQLGPGLNLRAASKSHFNEMDYLNKKYKYYKKIQHGRNSLLVDLIPGYRAGTLRIIKPDPEHFGRGEQYIWFSPFNSNAYEEASSSSETGSTSESASSSSAEEDNDSSSASEDARSDSGTNAMVLGRTQPTYPSYGYTSTPSTHAWMNRVYRSGNT